MSANENLTLASLSAIFLILEDKQAAKEIYRIFCGRECDEVICTSAQEKTRDGFRYYNFAVLARMKNETVNELIIRILEKMEDLDKFREDLFVNVFTYNDGQVNASFRTSKMRLMVYLLQSDELPRGKEICRASFPTGEDDIENYQVEIPTMIISTAGEGDGSEIGSLVRYLRSPQPGKPQFGHIGQALDNLQKDTLEKEAFQVRRRFVEFMLKEGYSIEKIHEWTKLTEDRILEIKAKISTETPPTEEGELTKASKMLEDLKKRACVKGYLIGHIAARLCLYMRIYNEQGEDAAEKSCIGRLNEKKLCTVLVKETGFSEDRILKMINDAKLNMQQEKEKLILAERNHGPKGAAKEFARFMLSDNFPIETIMEDTNLTKEEILEIKAKMTQ